MKKIPFLVILFICCHLNAFSAEFFHHYETEHGFTLHLPFGWYDAPESKIQLLSQAASSSESEESDELKYHYGYQKGSSDEWFTSPPYILITVNTTERLNEDEVKDIDATVEKMQREFDKTINENEQFIRDIYVENAWYDEEKKIFFSNLAFDTTDGNDIRSLSAIILTSSGHIDFYLYSSKDKFDENLSLFTDIVSSVSIEEEIQFTPRFSDNFLFLNRYNIIKSKKSPVFAIGALIICLLLWRVRQNYFSSK